MSNYYSDEEDLDIRFTRRRAPSPSPVNYVEARSRPRDYYPSAAQPSFLAPERTIITTRTRSRERSRERRSSPPTIIATAPPPPPAPAQAPAPVIINNRIYNEYSSDEDDERRMQAYRPRRREHSRDRSRGHSSHSRSPSSSYMTREEYEAERARQELAELRLSQAREKEERRVQKEYREEAELQRAKRDLDDIRKRESRTAEERQLKDKIALEKYQEEIRQEELRKKREKEAAEAVERYKQKEQQRIAEEKREQEEREKEFQRRLQEERQKELDRLAKEKKEKEEREKEYQRRLQEDLIKSGLDEKAIAAILKKEKIPQPAKPKPAPAPAPVPADNALVAHRATYTRMARKHLSIETLRTYQVEWELDVDPDYVLIKRWVPEWEQDTLWRHTRAVREKRSSKLVLEIEDKKQRREPEFEWVRKKNDRKRSKSPALLMYLAGAKPA
ncbi:Reticulocyte-binding protein 2-like protein a 5 [Colletotrichum chlorophyti]|uniref:Reticulocyte-binding protein 2-like protein a 5 n=1 Tax=Colletotrichum chlorophyti TaxID=708187 RepID=A0A1Q8RZB5_9PEZI|nr:Reticulocyte-binding protein 2-like protein a 5 [Colletotrichum chlorophyti]